MENVTGKSSATPKFAVRPGNPPITRPAKTPIMIAAKLPKVNTSAM